MTKDTFNEGLKLLKRFLKEENMYVPIFKKYLFENNRHIEDLFNEFNSKMYADVDDWTLLFRRWNLMRGPNDRSYTIYERLIVKNSIDSKWKEYYLDSKMPKK